MAWKRVFDRKKPNKIVISIPAGDDIVYDILEALPMGQQSAFVREAIIKLAEAGAIPSKRNRKKKVLSSSDAASSDAMFADKKKEGVSQGDHVNNTGHIFEEGNSHSLEIDVQFAQKRKRSTQSLGGAEEDEGIEALKNLADMT